MHITESLPKEIIIRHADDFDRLFGSGKRVAGKCIYLIYLPLTEEEKKTMPLQIGFVCGKKIGNAVYRNSCRRRMREIFRRNKNVFIGYKTLIVAQSAIAHSAREVLQHEILTLAQRLK
jgi:ribonuclease P protein component